MATFKRELQELLVVYAYKIKLKLFVKIYQKRYARDLDLQLLGVNSLESLFYKVITLSSSLVIICVTYHFPSRVFCFNCLV